MHCEDCKFGKEMVGSACEYRCKRFPPQLVVFSNHLQAMSHHDYKGPLVSKHDYCGEFKQKT